MPVLRVSLSADTDDVTIMSELSPELRAHVVHHMQRAFLSQALLAGRRDQMDMAFGALKVSRRVGVGLPCDKACCLSL